MDALDLFSGIGGFALACGNLGIRTVGFCEIDPFCRAVLAKNFPGVPIHDDIRTLDPEPFRGVDLVCGGFPCQDVSAAGKGRGIGGARSGLWVEMARIIAGVRPTWCLIENVSALRTRGADRVLADLEALGYDAWPLVVGAWAVGAPHRRERVWIVARRLDDAAEPRLAGDAGREPARALRYEARREESAGSRCGVAYADDGGLRADRGATGERSDADESSAGLADADRIGLGRCGQSQPRRLEGASGDEPDRCGARRAEAEDLADTSEPRLEGRRVGASSGEPELAMPASRGLPRWPARPGEPQHEWEQPRLVAYGSVESVGSTGQPRQDADSGNPEQPLGRLADGLPVGLVRTRRRNNREALKAYGNAVVPQVVEAILRGMLCR